ncbi:MAG: RimK family alpha-L-glutamate ligase [Planctomycetales bacterium]|nr:RimK family alpha-L-glutamate ligase [Planctomycetales bacterium]
MRVLVLGSPEGFYFNDLARAAGSEVALTAASFAQLSSTSAGGAIRVEAQQQRLAEFDAVLVRTMPPGSLEQVVFRMDALHQAERAGVRVVNPAKAIEAAVDKYLATCRLQQAGLLAPETHVCQTAQQALDAWRKLGEVAVLKPIFGGEGRGIALLEDEVLATRAFSLLERLGSVIYLQQFIEHPGSDLRLLVVGEKVFGMRRSNPRDWRTNISRGAVAEPLEVTPELGEIALRAARSVDARLAGVDLLPGADGELYALEVNASPGWRALAKATGRDISREVLNLLAS